MKCIAALLLRSTVQFASGLYSTIQDAVCLMSLAFMLQVWLPIRLIQNRVENEIKNNLTAVRRHSESLHGRQGSWEGARRI